MFSTFKHKPYNNHQIRRKTCYIAHNIPMCIHIYIHMYVTKIELHKYKMIKNQIDRFAMLKSNA